MYFNIISFHSFYQWTKTCSKAADVTTLEQCQEHCPDVVTAAFEHVFVRLVRVTKIMRILNNYDLRSIF